MISLLLPEDMARHHHTVGRAVGDVDLEVVDEEDHPLAAQTTGRVRLRGGGVATAFVAPTESEDRAPEPPREQAAGGWLYTGDLGSLDEEGYLTLRGRSDDLIVRGGVNIYPEVVEQALCRCPAVADAAVVGRPVSGAETEIWAFLLPNPTAHPPLTEALLFAHCRSVLPAWMHPTRVRLVESLPRTTSGKVKRKGLLSLI